ncbi:hypothetical protein MGA5115_00414 [Marinomonas gallaica]|uniref:Spore protein YkvP/CgeB glycosyl transferase-like domain-containing protein n=1 Tax=Marinomonas gallaica TaxID=1806667 RepID=A0A1C3JMI5_9GAMM|nr:hypothetical protein [Marinomonas gallaica]SBT16334.1 hypothetical protein MGA5115_00414 [Marinomonas gallaica]SBT21382.1 hypothetical protein MGA5116_01975 [Marinomonas gallaica]
MLKKPRTFFAIHRFESKCYEDSAGKLEVREPMVQSGLLGETQTYDFGWDETESLALINASVEQVKANIGDTPVVVYGAGAHTTQHWSQLATLNVVAIADKNPDLWGTTLKSLPIIGPKDIPKYAQHTIISSRAYEANILSELTVLLPDIECHRLYGDDYMSVRLDVWAQELEQRVLAFQPKLLVHTPTHVKENLSAEFFLRLKQQLPDLKILTIWWDYDEENTDSGYLEYERQVLRYADLVIENSNGTRLERMHKQMPPYDRHPNPEQVIFHPTWFDPSLFYYDPAIEKDIDIAIFGSRVGERGYWIDLLKEHYGDRFHHIGGVSGENRNPLPTAEYAELLRRTKIVVNTQTYPFREQCKGKVREAIQCGCVLIEQDNQETRLFEKMCQSNSIHYFSGRDDLFSLIDHHLKEFDDSNETSTARRNVLDWCLGLLKKM